MTAAEWRQQVGADANEPENPYASNLAKSHANMAVSKVIDSPVRGSKLTRTKGGGKLPQPTEHEIQNTILERLNFVKNGFFWRENSGLMTAEYKGVKRMWRAGIAGIADVMGLWQGTPIAIEVKRPGKKPSPDQLAFKRRFEECGGIYIVCTDAATVVKQLEEAMNERK